MEACAFDFAKKEYSAWFSLLVLSNDLDELPLELLQCLRCLGMVFYGLFAAAIMYY